MSNLTVKNDQMKNSAKLWQIAFFTMNDTIIYRDISSGIWFAGTLLAGIGYSHEVL